ncbi:hypothetical protein BH10ACT3_BH10ACT3_06630 [soil metagenome]
MPTPVERTHYQVLGLAPGASASQIRDAHRQLARLLHPDRLGDATDAERRLAERRMREVNQAWTALSDPDRRADYDRMLRAQATGPTGAGSAAYGSGASGPGSARSYGADVGATARNPQTGYPIDDDPDEFYRRLRESSIDPDEPQLAGWHFWLLRRGPIVAAVLVALFLFVATAYAGGGGGGSDQAVTTTVPPALDCVRITQGRTAVPVPCDSDNDGRIVTELPAALDCPAATSYVLVDNRFICVTTDPSVVGSTPTTLGG